VRLDLTDNELCAFVDNLDSHHKNSCSMGNGRERRTYITMQTGNVEIPVAGCRCTLTGMTSPSNPVKHGRNEYRSFTVIDNPFREFDDVGVPESAGCGI
jgi:hypothetical protein